MTVLVTAAMFEFMIKILHATLNTHTHLQNYDLYVLY